LEGDRQKMMAKTRTSILLATATILAAQSNPVYEIRGRVVDVDTGRAIAMARVQLNMSPMRTQANASGGAPQPERREERLLVTDPSGNFRLTNVPAGHVSLSCSKTGYLSADHPKGSQASFAVESNKDPITILYLRRHAVIHGAALDDRGNAADGTVQAFRLTMVNGRRVPQSAGSASVRPDGTFRIAGLSPGRYYAVYKPIGASMEGVFRRTVFPASRDLAGGRVLKVSSGEEQHIDFHLIAEPGFRIRGHVATESVSFFVVASPVDSGFEELDHQQIGGISYNTQDKTFVASSLPAGSYKITAQIWHNGIQQFATKRVELNRTALADVLLEPTAFGAVPVSVRFDGPPAEPKRQPQLLFHSKTQAFSASQDKDGNLTFRHGSPGIYALVRADLPGYVVKSARQGGRDVLQDGLLVPEDSTPEPVEIVMSPQSSAGSGVVLQQDSDGSERKEFVQVAIFQKTPIGLCLQMQQGLSWRPNTFARDHAIRLPPGEYAAIAWTGAGQIAHVPYNEPGFLDRHRSAIEHFTVSGGRQVLKIRRLLPEAAFEEQ
jgi:hypothetical protein